MKPKLTKALRAAGRFFMGVGRVKAADENRWRDEWTIPLFPLTLILDAEGTLSHEAKHLVQGAPEPVTGGATRERLEESDLIRLPAHTDIGGEAK